MALETTFKTIALADLHDTAAQMKDDRARFIQTHAVNTDEGIDLYYSFMVDGVIENFSVKGVQEDDEVPSITDLFLAAFVFENEARELFGVDMHDIAIDFAGKMYGPAEAAPMTFISPELKAAKDKALMAKASHATKQEKEGVASAAGKTGNTGQAHGEQSEESAVKPQASDDELEKKLAAMDPEKAAKVRAALEAKKAREAARKAGEVQ